MKVNEQRLQEIIHEEYIKIILEEQSAIDSEENNSDEYRRIIKEELNTLLKEHAKDYIWGVKAPYGRTANQYDLSVLKQDLLNE